MALTERKIRRAHGQMLWFNEAKGFGFITTEDGERIRVDSRGFAAGTAPEGRCGGRAVSFRVVGSGDEQTATDVAFVEDANPPRARLRSTRRGRSV